MNGKLNINISEGSIQITGHLSDSNLVDRVAIVDALMNAFELRGEKRDLACDMLLSADKAEKELTSKGLQEAIEKFVKVLQEGLKDEG